jgi:serine phosphatase RsbU (regulator of sigma subunit)
LHDAVLVETRAFMDGAPQLDDITLLVLNME